MSEQREMTLDEWVNRLPEFHLANKQYQQLKQHNNELATTVERLRDVVLDEVLKWVDGNDELLVRRIWDSLRLKMLEISPQQSLAEQHPDDEAVNKFAYQMKCKLAIARSKGRSGWDNPDLCTAESLVDMLVEHLQKPNAGNWIDIANFCMMLHLRGVNPRLLVNTLAEHDAKVARVAFTAGYELCQNIKDGG